MTDSKELRTDAPEMITRREALIRTTALSVALALRPRWAGGAAAQVGDDRAVLSRDALAELFRQPPREYAPVDNWWWEAGRLTREKITWQLQELKEKGVGGTWFYVRWLYGDGLSSDPPYWTPEWWDFTRHAIEEHERLGLTHWFSNWTSLEFQQDAVRKERARDPSLWGRRLVLYQTEADGTLELDATDELLDAAAYRKLGESLDFSSRKVLTHAVRDRKLKWKAPGSGWVVTALVAQPWDLNYLDERVGQRFVAAVLDEYEKRLPEFVGKTLAAFGADEMELLVQGDTVTTLFSPALPERIRARRGYDVTPFLIALFHDIGPRTDQIRCDYYDAMTALLEENFYRPPTTRLASRGMRHATLSQQGAAPLSQTMHYGDFFRYMRTFHVPGNEDPFWSKPGQRRLFGTKTSSSIAHLHGRQRAVLCVHYAAGWGQTQEENLAWTNEAYAKGLNLYCRHGAYYTLMGGWYEWVPPGDHFYQPHWRYWGTFSQYVTRLSCILSQGKHRADIALLYPITTLHANWIAGLPSEKWGSDAPDAKERKKDGAPESIEDVLSGETGPFGPAALAASRSVQDLTEAIYHDGMDLDLVHDDLLERATVRGNILEISGVEFRSIVLPSLSTIRLASMQKINEFYQAGGTVVAFGRLPTASAENGRDDPQLRALIETMFGSVPEGGSAVVQRSSARGGKACFVPGGVERVPGILSASIVRAVSAPEKDLLLLHKKIGATEVFFLFNVQQKSRELPVRFRAQGQAEIWNAFTGETRPVYHWKHVGDGLTELKLKMGPTEGVVVVFSPGPMPPAVIEGDLSHLERIEGEQALTLEGCDEAGGRKRFRVRHGAREYLAEAVIPAPPQRMRLPEQFAFRLEPTMDNRWGDFRYPASNTLIGAEARRFRYAEEDEVTGLERNWHRTDFDDSGWPETTYSYGPYWWHVGGFGPGGAPKELVESARRGDIDPHRVWSAGGESLRWQTYTFSKKFGSITVLPAADKFVRLFEGLQGVPDNFLVLDQPEPGNDTHYLFTHVHAERDGEYFLYVGARPEMRLASASLSESPAAPELTRAPKRIAAWINGASIPLDIGSERAESRAKVRLHQGWNTLLLEVVRPDAGPVALYATLHRSEPPKEERYVPLLRWFREPEPLIYDITPRKAKRVGWYRFRAPPGVRAMRLQMQARNVEAWVDGEPVAVASGRIILSTPRVRGAQVALRVEQEPGTYAGAVFPEPVSFECETGEIPLGDWSPHGLATYSGIGVYSREIRLEREHLRSKVILDLGLVRHVAEVIVNGRSAGVRLARPFRFDITEFVREGSNLLEIKVANTLANHMSTYPTQWVLGGERKAEISLPAPAERQTLSGLLGPVELIFLAPVRLVARETAAELRES